MKTIHNKIGFSLVEVLVTVAISTVVFAGIYSTYIVGNRAWVHYNDAISARREVRRAMTAMVIELREAENVRVVQGPEGSAIYFHNRIDGPVSFAWNRLGNDADKIIRYNRASKRILAQYISALSFNKLKDAVIVNVMANKRTSKGTENRAMLKEKVALRSKTKYFQ